MYLKLKCNCYHIISGHKGALNIHFLRGGGGGFEGFGENPIIFQGGCSKDQLCPTEYKVGTTEN